LFYYPLTASIDNAEAEAISLFSLRSLAGPYDQFPVKNGLLYEGRDTGTAIQGLELDFQFRVSGFYLLFANWSCPFEESVEITLLNTDLECIAHHSISRDYGSMHLESVEQLGLSQFRLSCADGQNYLLNIPIARLPFVGRAGIFSRLNSHLPGYRLKVKKI